VTAPTVEGVSPVVDAHGSTAARGAGADQCADGRRAGRCVGGGRTKKPSPPPCVCGRRIRVAPTVLAAGPITCGVCGTDFAPAQPDDDADGADEGTGP